MTDEDRVREDRRIADAEYTRQRANGATDGQAAEAALLAARNTYASPTGTPSCRCPYAGTWGHYSTCPTIAGRKSSGPLLPLPTPPTDD